MERKCKERKGIRTLKQYHPWNEMKSFAKILEALDADIICFQEVKSSRENLSPDTHRIPGFHALYSFCRTKNAGYSGVATFVRDGVPIVEAEEGITGILNNDPVNIGFTLPKAKIGSIDESLNEDYTMEELRSIDNEGRTVLSDHGSFVLVNTYCPNAPSDERLQFKLQYYNILERRIKGLLSSGRQVVVVGDINTSHRELDHCDPKQAMKEAGITDFMATPSRQWLDSLVHPTGPLVDTFRHFYPDREKAFTCWNTLIDARSVNYGTRLDYCLVSLPLLESVISSEIRADIYGSDHCPVDITMDGQKLARLFLSQLDSSGHPKLCSCFWDENLNRQKSILSFLSASKQSQADDNHEISDSIPREPSVSSTNSLPNNRKNPRHDPSIPTQLKKRKTTLDTFFKRKDNSGNTVHATSSSKDAPSESRTNDASKSDHVQNISLDLNHDMFETILESDDIGGMIEQREKTVASWSLLFTPKPPPLCFHGEPTREWTVNKSGPNKGRRFFLCNRPVGPNHGEKRSRSDPGPHRCDFFEWKHIKRQASNSPTNPSISTTGSTNPRKRKE